MSLFTKQYKVVPAKGSDALKLTVIQGNCRFGRKKWQPSNGFMTNITWRLSASETRDNAGLYSP